MSDISVGTPSAAFMPARHHKFIDKGEIMMLTVPKSGEFPEEDSCPFTGEFLVCDGSGNLFFGDLLKALFSLKKYPNLQDNEQFVIYAINTTGDTVDIVGRVIEFV